MKSNFLSLIKLTLILTGLAAALLSGPAQAEQPVFQVKDINLKGGGSLPSNLINVNGTLFFTAYDRTNGRELWKSDGSAAGTVLVKDIRLGTLGSSPNNLVSVNNTLFFAANDGMTGYELWTLGNPASPFFLPIIIK